MPLPNTTNVGTIIDFLKKENPGMPKDQRTAIALSHARKMGADIKPKMRASHFQTGVQVPIKEKKGGHNRRE